MRVPFLVLAPVSVFLGYATSLVSALRIQYLDLFLVLLGALLAHVSVNLFNEYHDFRRGLDVDANSKTKRTQFSVNSGALLENPDAAEAVHYGAIASLFVTTLIGTYFIVSQGLLIAPLGVIGVLIILSYAPRLIQHPVLCLVAPGVGFGPLIVIGTHVVLTGEYSVQAAIASLIPFFLVNNLLLLNQYPDIAADRRIGRQHFPIVYGERKGIMLYGNTIMATCGIIVLGIVSGIFPELSIVCLFPVGFAVMIFFGIARHGISLFRLLPYLGMNVGVTLVTTVFLGMSIIYG
ncbi:prenyltransferase [Granulosicoccus antarcticus]|nr:prenyltransferase [Granulosicoccus antarcticus]